jgi:hypothetical protein
MKSRSNPFTSAYRRRLTGDTACTGNVAVHWIARLSKSSKAFWMPLETALETASQSTGASNRR